MNNNESPFDTGEPREDYLDDKFFGDGDKESPLEETYTVGNLLEEMDPISENESLPSLDIDPITSFEISPGKAADVAYLAWENSGNITPADVSRMSRSDEYSAVDPVSGKDASEALWALSSYGLVSSDFSDRDNDTDNNRFYEFSTEDLLMEGSGDLDTSYMDDWGLEDISIEYSTGGSKQLKNPDHLCRLNVSSPEEAFQLIGEMQEEYEFEEGIYKRLSEHL